MGGPVCTGGVASFIGPAAGGAGAGGAGAGGGVLTDVATPTAACAPVGADLTGVVGPVVPMAFPGPLPAAPVVPAAPPVPLIPPIPVVPGAPPPVPLAAPGPAGAAAASPLVGVLTDGIGFPVDLAGGSK